MKQATLIERLAALESECTAMIDEVCKQEKKQFGNLPLDTIKQCTFGRFGDNPIAQAKGYLEAQQ